MFQNYNVSLDFHFGYLYRVKLKIPLNKLEAKRKKSRQTSGMLSCEQCYFMTEANEYLVQHQKALHIKAEPTYGELGIQTDSKLSLVDHTPDNMGKPFRCESCEYQTTRRGNLVRHTQKMHEGNKYHCVTCDFQTTSSGSLRIHNQSKHGEKRKGRRYKCDMCNYQTTDRKNMRRHKQSKHEGKKYNCDSCDHQATYIGNLTRHKLAMHEGIKYPCELCDYQATGIDTLYKHRVSIHEEKKQFCEICDYRATWKFQLKRHMLRHSGKKGPSDALKHEEIYKVLCVEKRNHVKQYRL